MSGHPHGEQLSAFLDSMLDVAQMREVAAHLAVCPHCRAEHEGLVRTRQMLQGIAAPPAPAPEFWADTYRRMRLGEQSQSPARPLWVLLQDAFQAPQRRWSAGLAAVAAVAALITAPWLANSSYNGSGRSTPGIASPQVDSVDVSALVQAHTETAARQPLADPDRQDMIAMDTSFAGDDAAMSPTDAPGPSGDASP